MRLIADSEGPGSRREIEEYVQTVLEQRTEIHDDTTSNRLARCITTSILARLGIEFL